MVSYPQVLKACVKKNHMVNVTEEDRHLLLAFLIECFRRQSPDPLLELTGLQGAAKSDSHRAIRKLIDPNRADLRSAP